MSSARLISRIPRYGIHLISSRDMIVAIVLAISAMILFFAAVHVDVGRLTPPTPPLGA